MWALFTSVVRHRRSQPVARIEILRRKSQGDYASSMHVFLSCLSFGLKCQSRIWISSMVRELKIGVFGSLDVSDVGIMILGAMYAGVLVILIVSQLYCEEMPCTSSCAARVKFLVLSLSWDCWGSVEIQL